MKDWEIEKVNALYKEIDELKKENARWSANALLFKRLDSIERKIDEICKCCNCDPIVTEKPTVKKTTKKTK